MSSQTELPKMNREFIFDASGNAVGCHEIHMHTQEAGCWGKNCNRLFSATTGLKIHQRKAHGINAQARFQLHDDLAAAQSAAESKKK